MIVRIERNSTKYVVKGLLHIRLHFLRFLVMITLDTRLVASILRTFFSFNSIVGVILAHYYCSRLQAILNIMYGFTDYLQAAHYCVSLVNSSDVTRKNFSCCRLSKKNFKFIAEPNRGERTANVSRVLACRVQGDRQHSNLRRRIPTLIPTTGQQIVFRHATIQHATVTYSKFRLICTVLADSRNASLCI